MRRECGSALKDSDLGILPQISVVTVTLDAGSDLRETVDSVVAQTGVSIQHIVKDGLSSDGSTSFLQEPGYAVEYIQRPDGGVYDAMNQALESVSGEYVHFLNSGDNYSSSDALHSVATAAQRAALPDLVITWYRNLEHDVVRTCPKTLSDWYLFRAALGHQAVYFRRDLFARLGVYDVNYRLLADHDFIFRALVASRSTYCVLPKVCVDYKGEGLSADPRYRQLKIQEAAQVRQSFFPGGRGVLYRLLHEATLWRLRTRLLGNSTFRKFYYAGVSALNR